MALSKTTPQLASPASHIKGQSNGMIVTPSAVQKAATLPCDLTIQTLCILAPSVVLREEEESSFGMITQQDR